MSIFLKKIQRVNPQDKQGPKKWYASQVTTEQMDETAVSEAIADETTLNAGEAMMAIRQLRKVILAALHNGKSVKLGNWGSFYAVAESDPADTAEALTAKNVKRVKINFRPGKEIKESLEKATFIWTDNMAGVDTTEEEDGGTPGEV